MHKKRRTLILKTMDREVNRTSIIQNIICSFGESVRELRQCNLSSVITYNVTFRPSDF